MDLIRCSALVVVVLGAAPVACVTYRDRVIVVTQHTHVDASGRAANAVASASANVNLSVNLGAAAAPAGAPARLDADAIARALDGYGHWVENPAYGYVWIPAEAQRGGFTPYLTAGQWVPTTDGWYWQSEYAWGAVPFHYGRWVMVASMWAWVPGAAFAPAWVAWRYGSGWAAWSPLPPEGAAFRAPHVYCAWSHLGGPGLHGRVVQGPAARSLYAYTAPLRTIYTAGGVYYSPGPRVPDAVATTARQQWSATQPTPRVGMPAGTPRVGVPVEGAPGGVAGRPSLESLLVADVPSVARVRTAANGTLRPLDSYPAPTQDVALRGSFEHAFDAQDEAPGVARPTITTALAAEPPRPHSSLASAVSAPSSSYSVVSAPRRMTWARALRDAAPPAYVPQRGEAPPSRIAAPVPFERPLSVPSTVGAAPSYAPRPSSMWAPPSMYNGAVVHRPPVAPPSYAPPFTSAYRMPGPVVMPGAPVSPMMAAPAQPQPYAPPSMVHTTPVPLAPQVAPPPARGVMPSASTGLSVMPSFTQQNAFH